MRIYIKSDTQTVESLTTEELVTRLRNNPSESIIGMCIHSQGIGVHYLFQNENKIGICRYAYSKVLNSFQRMYNTFNTNNKNFNTMPCPSDSTPLSITESQKNLFFSPEEIETLYQQEKQGVIAGAKENILVPYLQGSPLSLKQQQMLYCDLVASTNRLIPSFYDYCQQSILSLGKEKAERILRGSISSKEMDDNCTLTDDEKEECDTECRVFRFAFFAPNEIVNFSTLLYDGADYHPTVGDVLCYYRYCVQEALKNIGKSPVPAEELHVYSPNTLQTKLGTKNTHFEEGIYNPQGLLELDDSIFRCVMLLIQLQPAALNDETILKIFNHDGFPKYHYQILEVITDMLGVIKQAANNPITKETKYLEIYNNIAAAYSMKGWKNFKSHLEKGSKILSQMIPLRQFILSSHEFTMKEQGFLLESLGETKCVENPFEIINAFILLKNANILTAENRDVIKNHRDPTVLVNALYPLQSARILTAENRDVIKNHPNPTVLADALYQLQSARILTQDNFDAIKNHGNLGVLADADALYQLQSARILTQDNFDAIKNHGNLRVLADALYRLQFARVLTQDNFDAIENHQDPETLAIALRQLQFTGILTQDNFDAIKNHINPRALAEALYILQSAGILTAENRDAIKNHINPTALAEALRQLQSAGILTAENRDAIKNHPNPTALAEALRPLQSARILTAENRDAIKNHGNPTALAEALYSLQSAGILTAENRDAIKNHPNPTALANALRWLQSAGILITAENRDAIKNHRDPKVLANALCWLQSVEILTQDNFDAIKNHRDPTALANALRTLQSARILTQDNFDVIKNHRDPKALVDALHTLQFARILTQDNFNEIILFLQKSYQDCSQGRLFSSQHTNTIVEWLKKVYQSNGGEMIAVREIFTPDQTFDGALRAIQARLDKESHLEKQKSASYKTLQKIGKLPNENITDIPSRAPH